MNYLQYLVTPVGSRSQAPVPRHAKSPGLFPYLLGGGPTKPTVGAFVIVDGRFAAKVAAITGDSVTLHAWSDTYWKDDNGVIKPVDSTVVLSRAEWRQRARKPGFMHSGQPWSFNFGSGSLVGPLAAVAVVAGGGYYFYSRNKASS